MSPANGGPHGRRESRREFAFTVEQTPSERLRYYLTWLQTGRDEAKEIRAFNLAPSLRARFDAAYAQYLGALTRHLRRRTVLNVVGNLASALALAGTLLVLVWLIADGQVGVAAAGAAIVAIRMLASQVQTRRGHPRATQQCPGGERNMPVARELQDNALSSALTSAWLR